MGIRFNHWIECDTCPFGETEVFEDKNQDVNLTLNAALRAGWKMVPKARWTCPKCLIWHCSQ